MNEIFIQQYDLQPRIEAVVSGNGTAVDLTDTTGVVFTFRSRYSGTASTVTGGFISKVSGMVFVDLTGTFSNTVSPYWGTFKLYFQSGKNRSFPNDGSFVPFEVVSGIL